MEGSHYFYFLSIWYDPTPVIEPGTCRIIGGSSTNALPRPYALLCFNVETAQGVTQLFTVLVVARK